MERTTMVVRTSRRVPPGVRMLGRQVSRNCRDNRPLGGHARPVDPDLRIAEVAQGDESTLRAYWSVSAAARRLDEALIPIQPFEELLAEDDNQPSVRRHRWIAHDGEQPAGLILLELPTLDNVDAAHATVEVHPNHRRRGVGRALLDVLLERVRAERRSHVIGNVAEPLNGPPSAGAVFAASVGATRALDEVCRALEVNEVSVDRVAVQQAEAQAAAGGYELVQWLGPCPDELVDDLAVLTGRMSTDAPMGDLAWEAESWDRERVRESEARSTRLSRQWVTTAAREVATGHLVGYTDMGWSTRDSGTAFQWMTIVDATHRGHRLGMLVKAANLWALCREVPVLERVITWNAESNTHMIAINEALGFRPRLRFSQWQLQVPP
jgi:GNAT superfamily N-acetyltransferase/RimJ/RimL family protein N-acetyltransferase